MTDKISTGPAKSVADPASPRLTQCRFCCSEIPAQASKCRQCGEQLHPSPPSWDQRLGHLVKYVGYAAAILGLSATLREGYYLVQARQQAREAFASYLAAAEDFRRLDNLAYARQALDRALEIYPDSPAIARARFSLAATSLLREADAWGVMSIDEAGHLEITTLVQDGFRLLQLPNSRPEQAELLVLLGRLLSYDQNWSDNNEIGSLFAQANQLTPDSAPASFYLGHWLLSADDPQAGFDHINRAIEIDPGNPFYLAELGEHLLAEQRMADALHPLLDASSTSDDQLTLQQIRAVNGAKRSLASWLIAADQKSDILNTPFFGLSVTDLEAVIDSALKANGTNRDLNYLAARFFNHHQQPEKALSAIKEALYDDGSLNYISSSDEDRLPLYLELLEKLQKEPETRKLLRKILHPRSTS